MLNVGRISDGGGNDEGDREGARDGVIQLTMVDLMASLGESKILLDGNGMGSMLVLSGR